VTIDEARAQHVSAFRSSGPHLSVGINSADLAAVGTAVAEVEAAGGSMLHIDVMDGHFTPQLTVGPAFIAAIRTPLLKDVHLMIDEPLGTLSDYVAAGADMITIHVESTRHPHRALRVLADVASVNAPGRPVIRGLALNPGTPVEWIEPLLGETDYLLILSVDPGWRGAFANGTGGRVAAARALIQRSGRPTLLGVDGGVTRQNIVEVASFGADIVVSGTAIFDGRATPRETVRYMRDRLGGPLAATLG
jgi:ribulose-phosphate 3-epimerase